MLLAQTHIVESLVYNGSRRHGNHSAQVNAIHLLPAEHPPHRYTDDNHAQNNGGSGDYRRTSNLQQFLDAELQPQSEQEKNNAYFRP